jgi:hypothetical protein
MEESHTREDQPISSPSVSPAAPRLTIWRRLKTYSAKRLLFVCISLGLGLGIGIVGTAVFVTWLMDRPIAPRDWPRLDIEAVGLKAKLKTDWEGSVRYQFVVAPRSEDLKAAFDSAARSDSHSVSFTIHLFDKAGFELCKTEVTPTPVVDDSNRVQGLRANDIFHSYQCSRSDYKKVDHWSVSYVFPKLSAKTASDKPTVEAETGRVSGDDRLTGFDLSNGHLETLSGRTFLIYREGERTSAALWEISQTEGQAKIHFSCKAADDCLIENPQKHQTLHGKLLR